jgi:hypothetical protein
MLENLLSPKNLMNFFNQEFDGKTVNITDPVYSKNSDIQLINIYSEQKIYLSIHARKNQNKETVNNFVDKLTYAKSNGDIFIPIWLTKGKKSEFIHKFNGSKQAIRNVKEATDDLYNIHSKVREASNFQNGNLFVLVQKEIKNQTKLILKHFHSTPVHRRRFNLPVDIDTYPISEKNELESNSQYKKQLRTSSLHMTHRWNSTNISSDLMEYVIKTQLIEIIN